jgi:hypothetical protein
MHPLSSTIRFFNFSVKFYFLSLKFFAWKTGWCTTHLERSRSISVKCRIRLIDHAQNEFLHLLKPEIYFNPFVLLNALPTFVNLQAPSAKFHFKFK